MEMVTEILVCKCEEEGCEHEFISDSCDYLECPVCGSENITGSWKKAIIFHDLDTCEIRRDTQLSKKIRTGALNIVDDIEILKGLRDIIVDCFKEHNLKMPKVVNLKFNTSYDCQEPEKYLYDLDFEGIDDVPSDIISELVNTMGDEYSVSQLLDNSIIYLNQHQEEEDV